jgi:hypothetical protein
MIHPKCRKVSSYARAESRLKSPIQTAAKTPQSPHRSASVNHLRHKSVWSKVNSLNNLFSCPSELGTPLAEMYTNPRVLTPHSLKNFGFPTRASENSHMPNLNLCLIRFPIRTGSRIRSLT